MDMRAVSDAALVHAMQRGDELAFREFIARFERQLEQYARRFGLGTIDRRTIAAETMDDAAMNLIAPGRATPRSLKAYLLTSLRNRLRNEYRSGARARVREGHAVHDAAGDVGAPITSSQDSLRASAGPAWEPVDVAPAVTSLANLLVSELTDDECELLSWVSNYVPYREIASWLGVGYAAVGKRVERLRTRLRARAETYLATLPVRERAQLHALLSRGAVPGRLEPRPVVAPRAAARTIPREGVSR